VVQRQRIVLAVGLPGSGKSAWFARRGITPLSSDRLREVLCDDATEQRYQKWIFQMLRSQLRMRLRLGRPVTFVDATNLTRAERQPYFRIARQFGCEVEAVFFDVPLEVCRKRNRERARVVPEEAMLRLAGRFEAPRIEEGFRRITRVDAAGRAGRAIIGPRRKP